LQKLSVVVVVLIVFGDVIKNFNVDHIIKKYSYDMGLMAVCDKCAAVISPK
jgi:hypothetical protein